jgi:hypothetical protein
MVMSWDDTGGATMVTERQLAQATIASGSIPALLERRVTPSSLVQAELPDLQRTRSLQFDELHSPVIRTAIAYWMSKQENGGPMRRSHFDATEIPHLLPYLILLEVLPHRRGSLAEPGIDFRYRVMGDVVLRYSRGNYTGKYLSEIDGQGPGSEVWSINSTVVEQRRPVLVRPPYVGPHHHVFHCEACVLPMVSEQGDVARLLIAGDFLTETSDSHNGSAPEPDGVTSLIPGDL